MYTTVIKKNEKESKIENGLNTLDKDLNNEGKGKQGMIKFKLDLWNKDSPDYLDDIVKRWQDFDSSDYFDEEETNLLSNNNADEMFQNSKLISENDEITWSRGSGQKTHIFQTPFGKKKLGIEAKRSLSKMMKQKENMWESKKDCLGEDNGSGLVEQQQSVNLDLSNTVPFVGNKKFQRSQGNIEALQHDMVQKMNYLMNTKNEDWNGKKGSLFNADQNWETEYLLDDSKDFGYDFIIERNGLENIHEGRDVKQKGKMLLNKDVVTVYGEEEMIPLSSLKIVFLFFFSCAVATHFVITWLILRNRKKSTVLMNGLDPMKEKSLDYDSSHFNCADKMEEYNPYKEFNV